MMPHTMPEKDEWIEDIGINQLPAARFATWSDECSKSLQGIIEKTIARRTTVLYKE